MALQRSASWLRSWAHASWPRLVAFLLLAPLLVGAFCYARAPDRLPLWLVIAAFVALSAAITILIEYGKRTNRGQEPGGE